MLSEEEKKVESFKRYINSQEQKLDDYYRMDEEFYQDEIEQIELSLKLLKYVLGLLEKQQKELEEEKEKNKELQKYEEAYKLLSYGLNNYISKDKIKAEMEDIIDYFEYANATSEDMEFLEKKKKEILEGK